MTTVAWDGKALAGDTLGTRGNLKHLVEAKVFRLDDGRLYGGCGDYPDVIAMRDWLNGLSDRPACNDYSGMVVDERGCWLYGDRGPPLHAPFKFFAIGSGRDFAIAAMHLGQTARQAVELACVYDAWTGGEVQAMEFA